MLKKENRANKKDLEKVFKKSHFLSSPNLSFRYIKALKTKISFIAPKSVNKGAVVRNSLRRKGYLAFKKHLNSLPFPVVGAFVFKRNDTQELENEIKNLFSKVN